MAGSLPWHTIPSILTLCYSGLEPLENFASPVSAHGVSLRTLTYLLYRPDTEMVPKLALKISVDCNPFLPKYFVNGIGTSCVLGCSSNTYESVSRQRKTGGL